jgi:hypothetical protein
MINFGETGRKYYGKQSNGGQLASSQTTITICSFVVFQCAKLRRC